MAREKRRSEKQDTVAELFEELASAIVAGHGIFRDDNLTRGEVYAARRELENIACAYRERAQHNREKGL